MDPRRESPGISPVIATMLLVGLTVLLSGLVYLLVAGYPSLGHPESAAAFQVIRIVEIYDDEDLSPYPNCKKSCMVLMNGGTNPVENGDLMVKVWRNGEPVDCNIFSLHGQTYNFSPLRHGVQRIEGEGARGTTWDPGEEIRIDFNNGTFHPGDEVRIEIIRSSTGTILSSDTFQVM